MLWYVLIIGLLAYGLLTFVGINIDRRRKAERSHITLEAFSEGFRDRRYEPNAIKAAYDDILKTLGHPAFPHDELEKTLGFDWQDFEEMLDERCRKLGIGKAEETEYAKLLPLWTVEDYVRFISEVMRGEHGKTVS